MTRLSRAVQVDIYDLRTFRNAPAQPGARPEAGRSETLAGAGCARPGQTGDHWQNVLNDSLPHVRIVLPRIAGQCGSAVGERSGSTVLHLCSHACKADSTG